MAENVIIHRSDMVTPVMEKMIPELQSYAHGEAVPCLAYSPCGDVVGPIWCCALENGGYGVFMPQHVKRYLFDKQMSYIACTIGDVYLYDNVRCSVIALDGRAALQFEFANY